MVGQQSMRGDNLPGTPWTPPDPEPDGNAPPGDGKHRKDDDEADGK